MTEIMETPRSCVTPDGKFIYGIHKPAYSVANVRPSEKIAILGTLDTGTPITNEGNYPQENLKVEKADWIFEIPNAFPFRGTTYIDKEWADASAKNYDQIRLPDRETVSLSDLLSQESMATDFLEKMPRPLQLALATCSTDPHDLKRLAELSCEFDMDETGTPEGLRYNELPGKGIKPIVHDHDLFEAVANNPYLPDSYKIAMVINPGAQGGSEIVGEWPADDSTHVFEYLRRNSYIAGGHYAANMADDAIRYSIRELSSRDMQALRHLYYQRTYLRMAEELRLDIDIERRLFSKEELEELRVEILTNLANGPLSHTSTLWGWNFGFDYAPSDYRLHASHQQIHQQYAMIPENIDTYSGNPEQSKGSLSAFSSGDMIARVIDQYGQACNRDFFEDYFGSIANNERMDGRTDLESDLVVWQDERAMLFVPKAQTSQWELQLVTKKDSANRYPGNIIETDSSFRDSLDRGILMAQKTLSGLGARMVTSIEYSKRIGKKDRYQQPLLYAFLPKLPQSPGAFSEAQLRFINGHYPEDFAAVCRRQLPSINGM